MLGVILTITLSLANSILPRLRSSSDALSSVAAIYAADSGVDGSRAAGEADLHPPLPLTTELHHADSGGGLADGEGADEIV